MKPIYVFIGTPIVCITVVSALYGQDRTPRIRPPEPLSTTLTRAYGGIEGIEGISGEPVAVAARPVTVTISGSGAGACTVRVLPGDGSHQDVPGRGFPRQFQHSYTENGRKLLAAFASSGCGAKWAWTSIDVGRVSAARTELRRIYLKFSLLSDGVSPLLVEGDLIGSTWGAYCGSKGTLGICTSFFGWYWNAQPQENLKAKVVFAGSSGSGPAYAGIVLVRTSYPDAGWSDHWHLIYPENAGQKVRDPVSIGRLAGWPVPAPWNGEILFKAPAAVGIYSIWVRIFIPGETQPYFGLLGDLYVK